MKSPVGSLVRVEPQRLGCAALIGCLVVPLVILAVTRPSSLPPPSNIVNLHLSIVRNDEPTLLIEDTNSSRQLSGNGEITLLIGDKTSSSRQSGNDDAKESIGDTNNSARKSSSTEPKLSIGNKNSSVQSERTTTTIQASKMVCDVSEPRTDICEMYGDVRINGSSSSIVLVRSSPAETTSTSTGNDSSTKIRPYARKWEAPVMAYIKEFSLTSLSAAAAPEGNPHRCSVNYSVPAVVFSTGGFQGNFFHEMTDVLIPLFLTSHHYRGEVRFLITDFKSWWVDKYRAILRQLSRYEVIDLDAAGGVHCFRRATVGLRSHTELGIDPLKSPKGYSMFDFRRFLRACYSLKRGDRPPRRGSDKKKPRLLIISRKRSRSLTNERQVVRTARRLGYRVTVAGPGATGRNLTRFAQTVNSCDVMMGVHGAGLANMVFLPTNATVIQVIPWGELRYACRFALGDPAVGMGLRYLEYEIGMDESSLIKRYPRDHAVFADPLSIHRQGFNSLWSVFLDRQNVTLNVGRFRTVLLEALRWAGQ